MESPFSQNSIFMPVEDSGCHPGLGKVRTARLGQFSSAGFDYVGPSTLEGHNSFVRTLFPVFLDSMEIPLSQDSICMPLEDSGC